MDSLGLDNPQGVNDAAAGVSYLWSQESLECLLYATNSTEEDESISVFFSDCNNLWNLSSDYAISSGESENNASFCRHKDVRRQASERDEAISAHLGSSNSRPNSKRISEGQEPKTVMASNYFDLLQSDSSTTGGRFQPITDNQPKPKKPRIEKYQNSPTIDFGQSNNTGSSLGTPDAEDIACKEMMYRAAVLRPVNFGPELVEKPKPKRKNVRLSSDPHTVAARQRRERISERIKILQRLIPGGTKMDTASMLDEAANYLKFLKLQISALEALGHKVDAKHYTSFSVPFSLPFYQPISMQTFFPYP